MMMVVAIVAPVHGSHEIHPLDLVRLGALLDDHRQTAVHLVQEKEGGSYDVRIMDERIREVRT